MSTNYEKLASMEELDSLMDEMEASRTMVSTAPPAAAAATTSSAASATAFVAAASVVSIPAAAISSTTPAASITLRVDTSQKPSIPAKPVEPEPAQPLSKISVWMEERDPEEPESLNIAHFDDASLANCAVPLSFDDSSPAGTTSSLSFAKANPLNFIPGHQHINTAIPTTPGGNAFASSRFNSVAPRGTGSLQEVITISFQTIEGRNSCLGRLEREKGIRSDGMAISIKVLENEKQMEVSGPVGSNIRGFVREFCPNKYITASIK
ncbi:hypothetical protein EYC80_004536 [Monilinia laxa]|uniref:Uncharacterized protein n=1 Tax=Monilinia laxa TaxID=61186 RepID=A0A5N6KH24_MONLA|nr:hypothetical protein EYC80_004536 [Monilinia laxa]